MPFSDAGAVGWPVLNSGDHFASGEGGRRGEFNRGDAKSAKEEEGDHGSHGFLGLKIESSIRTHPWLFSLSLRSLRLCG